MQRDEYKRPAAREGGFTLLEVIVAISILTVGLLAVASMQSAAIRGNQLGYRVTEGSTLAQDRVEWLFAQPYNNLLAVSGAGQQADPLATPAGYTINYQVQPHGTLNALIITVTVSLQERQATRTTSLSCVRPQLL
jgi:prepilin-type N-terminal cleavage/methylation domain-containing protein